MNLTNISTVKDLLNRHGFSFSKGLGQNFLINPSVCPKIAEMGNANQDFGIIEIGTGFGTLTAELARRAKKVVAIEIDSRLIPVLDETLAEFDNIKIINQDFMETDLNKIISEEFSGMKVAVCANLPYYITSPVIMKLLESRVPIESITVMVQKEAGQRLCAEVGTRESGAITVAVNYYGTAKMLFNVSRGSFMPAPNVDSCVIRIDVNKNYLLEKNAEDFFFKIVKCGFAQRRKTIAKSISSQMNISKPEIQNILKSMSLSETARTEQLNMNQLIQLSENLRNII
ncbi:MAG: 16S rRNA (adenine(1518)-N(6)/adenine(1519)-N(6))-dimethyltransferase RsmA [Oscillospiraceae bacterium]|nr:16S rRNA (adenine(1518)-N(6)/adenine(1519)-N(6))-dimethyltransferase RsmA [Oscillospiraceae bacterium]